MVSDRIRSRRLDWVFGPGFAGFEMVDRLHRVGVALSGGGVRGAAHVGLIRALREHHIEITAWAGASSGALVAAMCACGRSPDDILKIFRKNEMFTWSHFGLTQKPGLLDSERLLKVVERAVGGITFSELNDELHIVATDLLQGEEYYFREGAVARAVMASASFPGFVSPMEVDEHLFSDGGIVNNLPIEPLLGRCRVLIGSHVNPVEPKKRGDLETTVAVSQRAFQIATAKQTDSKLKSCDFCIAPSALLDIGLFDFERSNEAYEIGYEAALGIVDEVAASVSEVAN